MLRALSLGLVCLAFSASAGELETLDALFHERDAPGRVEELERRLAEALRAQPGSVEHLWRLARLRCWQADAAPDKAAKRRLGREGWELGDRVAQLAPGRAEGPYYAAVAVGAYGDGAGVLAAVREGLERKFLQRIDRAIALDPWLDQGGPLVARGRYHFTMPWPKRDLKRARALYEQVLARFPGNLRARYYLAQLELREGSVPAAREAVVRVLTAPPGGDPPEERRIKGWSRRVQRQVEEALREEGR